MATLIIEALLHPFPLPSLSETEPVRGSHLTAICSPAPTSLGGVTLYPAQPHAAEVFEYRSSQPADVAFFAAPAQYLCI